MQEMMNFLGLYFAQGVVRYRKRAFYWTISKMSLGGLLGNDFFKRVMTYRRYINLDRFISIRSSWLTEEFNRLSAENWIPGTLLSLDDNVELWKGRFGQHKAIMRKADKVGHVTWEATDEYKFVVAMIWEYHIRPAAGDTVSISQKRFRRLVDLLPDGPYKLFIDAGDFGSLQNALYLVEKKKQFIMSISNSKSAYLFKYLQQYLQPHQWKSISNQTLAASSYRPRVAKKCINFLTNVNSIFFLVSLYLVVF